MNNIKIIETDIDVSKILKQLQKYPEDWGSQKKKDNIELIDYNKYKITVDVLQLIIGGVNTKDEYVGDTEICIKTECYYRHTEILNFIKNRFKKISELKRCAFLGMPVGGEVGSHIDFGSYYLNKDRYHISIQGKYCYTVGDESINVEPGTFFWFNNKLKHSSTNIGEETRITFVFDIPHNKSNPQHRMSKYNGSN